MWKKISKFFKELGWVTKFLTWVKAPIPYLPVISAIIVGINYAINAAKKKVFKQTKEASDTTVSQTQVQGEVMEAERAKPLPEQDNDVLREAARRRYGGVP